MANGDFKNLNKRTAGDKVFHHSYAFNIAKDAKCDGYQYGPTSIIYKHFN